MTTHPIERLRLREASGERPRGYADTVIAAGMVVDGVVELTPEAFMKLRQRFAPVSEPRGALVGEVRVCLRTLRKEAANRQPGFAESVLEAGRMGAGCVYIKRTDLDLLRSQFKLTTGN